jgi:putative colanic acid biosynthesis acetyltransferase WcaB
MYWQPKYIKIIFLPYFVFYKLITEFVLGLELPLGTKVGSGLILYHCFGLVVNQGSTIGDNCILRHGVTIGNKVLKDGSESKCPVLGDNVEIGANAVLIGDIKIGDAAKVGAGSVVTKNIPNGKVAISSQLRFF